MSTRITVPRVLTSFVPPFHNQGVSLAPLQGHALWKIFLPAAGSFFVISLTDLHASLTGALRRTFPQPVPHTSQPFLSWLDSAPGTVCRRLSPTLTGYYLFLFPLLCRLYLRPPDAAQQLLRVIPDTFCKDYIKYPQHLAGYRHYGLHLFERVLFPRPVILVYLPELCILPRQPVFDPRKLLLRLETQIQLLISA